MAQQYLEAMIFQARRRYRILPKPPFVGGKLVSTAVTPYYEEPSSRQILLLLTMLTLFSLISRWLLRR